MLLTHYFLICFSKSAFLYTIGRLAAILDLIQPEMAPFDSPSPKTPPRTKNEGDPMTHCGVMAI